MPIENPLQQAIRHHQSGNLAAASQCYERIVLDDPNCAEAWRLFAILAHQVGRTDAAIDMFSTSLRLDPECADTYYDFGVALLQAGGFAAATAMFNAAVAQRPDYAAAHYNLGVAAEKQGEDIAAEEAYRSAIALDPALLPAQVNLGTLLRRHGDNEQALDHFQRAALLDPTRAVSHSDVGATLRDLGRPDEAELALRKALTLDPDLAIGHVNLGLVYEATERPAAAEAAFRRAIECDPNNYEAHVNLSSFLAVKDEVEEAERLARRAVTLRPDYADAYNNLAVVLPFARADEAVAAANKALELRPDFPEAWNNLTSILVSMRRNEDAEAAARKAIECRPDYAEAHHGLSVVLGYQNRLGEAEIEGRRALELRPDSATFLSNFGMVLCSQGRVEEGLSYCRRAMEVMPSYAVAHSNLLFFMPFLPTTSSEDAQSERRRWYERHGAPRARRIRPHTNVPDPDRRLRIGYCSADFRQHAAAFVFSPVLVNGDRDAFEIYCYSDTPTEDVYTRLFRDVANGWRSIRGIRDEDVAEMVRADGIDILVDLSGHSGDHRLLVFAEKPAPVQVSALGHPAGTGLPTIDYLFSDSITIPAAERHLYAETIYDLPCAQGFEPPVSAPEVGPLPVSQGAPLTFGTLNRTSKITDDVLRLWADILTELPEARLLFKDHGFDDAALRQTFLSKLEALGVAPERVELRGGSTRRDHLGTCNEIDIGLDPFPLGGGVTTLEHLWMGTPVITLRANSLQGRLSQSILHNLGLDEFTVPDKAGYRALARALAEDRDRLAALRAGMRDRFARSDMGNPERFARVVEAAYRDIWRRWCASADGR